jgi:hypothetical protein
MIGDIETLRGFVDDYCSHDDGGKVQSALERLVADRDRLQGRVATLQEALDDRHADDLKAWSAIMRATGKERGIPDNKEVVAWHVAEMERLEKERKRWEAVAESAWKSLDAEFNRGIRQVPLVKQLLDVKSERDSLRAKLDRAKEALARIMQWYDGSAKTSCPEVAQEARAILSELSADALDAASAVDGAGAQERLK